MAATEYGNVVVKSNTWGRKQLPTIYEGELVIGKTGGAAGAASRLGFASWAAVNAAGTGVS